MNESDKKVEKFIKKVMEEAALETPSFDFTSKIMAQVAVSEQRKVKGYKPLISKSVWLVIAVILIAMIIYAMFPDSEKTQFDIDLSAKISNLIPAIHLSDATAYAILSVTLMVLIQILLLKNYFDKRFEV